MKTYYHVTPTVNLDSILTRGLLPTVGERSSQLNEEPCIFLFPTYGYMYDAVSNWLGDCFDEDVELTLLEIILPDIFPINDSTVEYEKISLNPIPSEYISIKEWS